MNIQNFKSSHYPLVGIALAAKENSQLTLPRILADVCTAFGQKVEAVKSGSKRELALCKKIFCYVSKLKTKYTLKQIVRAIDLTDHTTARHHFYTVKYFLKVHDPDFMEQWEHYLESSRLFNKNDFKQ